MHHPERRCVCVRAPDRAYGEGPDRGKEGRCLPPLRGEVVQEGLLLREERLHVSMSRLQVMEQPDPTLPKQGECADLSIEFEDQCAEFVREFSILPVEHGEEPDPIHQVFQRGRSE